jgi:3-hydroxyisobutyrate dehydrogenase-like beta-hydroxyacid dehydrogenase
MATIGFIGASGSWATAWRRTCSPTGHELALTVHRNRERLADLLAAGASEAASPAALATSSEIVFLCVTGSPQVEAAVEGPEGLLASAKRRPGLVVVDCSTSEPIRRRGCGASAPRPA